MAVEIYLEAGKLYLIDTETGATKLLDIVIPKTDTISEKTATAGVTIDGILIKDSLDVSNIVNKSSAQTIAGVKTLSDNLVFSGDKIIQTNVKVRAYLSTNQLNLVNGAYTKVLLDAESYDVGNDFASYKFTAPVTGYYSIIGSVLFMEVVADKVYDILIYKNGAIVSGGGINSSTTDNLFTKIQDVLLLNATDYIELFVRQTSGVSTVDIYGAETHTFFVVHLISI